MRIIHFSVPTALSILLWYSIIIGSMEIYKAASNHTLPTSLNETRDTPTKPLSNYDRLQIESHKRMKKRSLAVFLCAIFVVIGGTLSQRAIILLSNRIFKWRTHFRVIYNNHAIGKHNYIVQYRKDPWWRWKRISHFHGKFQSTFDDDLAAVEEMRRAKEHHLFEPTTEIIED
jgi:hypothetical protein